MAHPRHGLPPYHCCALLRAVGWAQVSYGAEVALPELRGTAQAWARALKRIQGGRFPGHHHRVEMQRECGLLHHPVYWMMKRCIRWISKEAGADDELLTKTLMLCEPTETLAARRMRAILHIGGLTEEECRRRPSKDLIKDATKACREWMRTQLVSEATRLGHYNPEDAVWDMQDAPQRYLRFPMARPGPRFRAHQLGPAPSEPRPCPFCRKEAADTGRHLALICTKLPPELARPNVDHESTEAGRERIMMLHPEAPEETVPRVLRWMGAVLRARGRIRHRRSHATSGM
eukprot:GHVT01092176.1.p1 GENE.GHVT01092176.1~~GHVT01092176.1.p1  ORF type:complete len:289 (-),score=22.60 GHVT01092176.1:1287-2153(-)